MYLLPGKHLIPAFIEPTETLILKLPNHQELEWQEATRSFTDSSGEVKYIPLDQDPENWLNAINICYDKIEELSFTAQNLADIMQCVVFVTRLKQSPTWKIIEMHKHDFIYETNLAKPCKDFPAQYEMARIFLSKTGFHRIGFNCKNREMNISEKEKTVKLLRESVAIVNMEDAKKTPGLSLADKIRDSLDLGTHFENWKELNTIALENGYTIVIKIPPTLQIGDYIDECLEITTTSILNNVSMDSLFDIEKKLIRTAASRPVKFQILHQNPMEVIYSYIHLKDHLQCNGVVRSFIANRGYYSVHYKHGLSSKMEQEAILRWKGYLEAIKIKHT